MRQGLHCSQPGGEDSVRRQQRTAPIVGGPMNRRTKWSISVTVALAVIAVGFLVFLIASDNPDITPLMVRNATAGVLEVTLSLVALVWIVWYWMGKRSRAGR
jgi:hypothetical protein